MRVEGRIERYRRVGQRNAYVRYTWRSAVRRTTTALVCMMLGLLAACGNRMVSFTAEEQEENMEQQLNSILNCGDIRAENIAQCLRETGISSLDKIIVFSSGTETILNLTSAGKDYSVTLNRKYRVEIILDASGTILYGVVE